MLTNWCISFVAVMATATTATLTTTGGRNINAGNIPKAARTAQTH